ncbi:Zinc finger protein [Wickerhamomyces ciferrii]|uniref:Zinc finger protein n=1 Tax=Wickerhamomyces ciferrii (strain ATCC 14091 / BCRC 22168 / CBS 111 / JCM 3599 / NBRC 0793 / NRRL Y-1031 F-60-10) TaxID=1206466 RepID=K0KPD1_WICCF|nr:Zinc finger protein [Wickerhamomyces ciferrii]CCH42998.1 Zinc finger protein [Wickerhamomyces ciferrii]
MSGNQPRSGNKPSFFKTLPENIATSPTGIVKISHSPFPSLNPNKQFKSVYERAGFDVYKPNKSRSNSRVTSPTIEHGFRSQSAAQLNQPPSGFPRVFDEKRNMSEQNYVGQPQQRSTNNGYKYGDQVPGFNKAALNIDANLANSSERGEISAQMSTPSVATSTFDRHGGGQPFSSTSTTFTDTDNRSPSSRTYSNDNDVSNNQFVSAQSLPYTSPDRNSKNSIPTYRSNGVASTPSASGSPDEYSFAPTHVNNEGYSRSIQPQNPYNQTFYNNQNQFEPRSAGTDYNDEADTSINTVKYTPKADVGNRDSRPMLQAHEDLLASTTMDKSLEGFNPISNSTGIDSSINNGTPSDGGDISDDESFKSEILSPKFNFETSKENAEDVTSNHDETTRNLELNLPPSPQKQQEPYFQPQPQSPAPPSQSTIPQFIVSDSDGNIQYQDDVKSPSPTYNQNSRQSAVSMAASSIYSNEDKNEQLQSTHIPDTIEENEEEFEDAQQYNQAPQYDSQPVQQYEDDYNNDYNSQPGQQYEDDYNNNYTPQRDLHNNFDHEYDDDLNNAHESSGPVYEEIEQQLETLSMRSKSPLPPQAQVQSQPPQIMVHSVKEVSTDDINNHRDAPEPPLHHRRLNSEVKSFDENQQTVHSNGYQGDQQPEPEHHQYHEHDHDYQPQEQEITQPEHKEPEIPKWPPGEGPCRKCGLEIETKPIYSKSGELSGQWHRECFTCTVCDLKFNKKTTCFVLNDMPYCEYHYHLTNNSLCKVCGEGIVGKCLENDAADRYHVDCLKCTKCSKQITSDYLSINDKVHCESCALEFTSSSQLGIDNELVERRRTRLFYID